MEDGGEYRNLRSRASFENGMSNPSWEALGAELSEVESQFLIAEDAVHQRDALEEPSESELAARAELETARRRLRALKEIVASATR